MSSQPNPTFTMFTCPPREVQLLIWDSLIAQSAQMLLMTQPDRFWATSNKLSIFTPHGTATGMYRFLYADGTERFSVKTSGKVPTVLHTSANSRALALGQCHRILLNTADHPRYFKFSTETLTIRCQAQWGSSSPISNPSLQESRARVQNLFVIGCRLNRCAFLRVSLVPFLGRENMTLHKRRGWRREEGLRDAPDKPLKGSGERRRFRDRKLMDGKPLYHQT
ncbi:hypothetical protein BUE80_DR001857 [Diplocarpon rosae]|nr:hypothetical protein BUE80_DR001857 [Diplocarpon rosae]